MAEQSRIKQVFSAQDLARFCGVANQTAINWIKAGHIAAYTTPGGQYRIYPRDVAVFLDQKGMRHPEELTRLLGFHRRITDCVLVICNDLAISDSLRITIENLRSGSIVHQAFDCFTAGRLAFEHRPGLVFLDPGAEGLEGQRILRTLQEDESYGNPEIILLVDQESGEPSPLGSGNRHDRPGNGSSPRLCIPPGRQDVESLLRQLTT